MTGSTVLVLTGGVGGAKLALGLADSLPPGQLHALVNTGDDFRHLGLHISPDIDTLIYTLSGRANAEQGWGLAGESWNVMDALEELGGETWFRLGDRDLATHLWRSARLAAGESLAAVTGELARRFGVDSRIHPMSNDPVRTRVKTPEGDLPFQAYFVGRRCEPRVEAVAFDGIGQARANPALFALLADSALDLIVLCPSNPFLSLDPVLRVPGVWRALAAAPVPVVAVSPIVGGNAIKGPTARIMQELGLAVSASGVAAYYQEQYPGLLNHFIVDDVDSNETDVLRSMGLAVSTAPTVMRSRADKRDLAQFILDQHGVAAR